jgi:hypothetical protein
MKRVSRQRAVQGRGRVDRLTLGLCALGAASLVIAQHAYAEPDSEQQAGAEHEPMRDRPVRDDDVDLATATPDPAPPVPTVLEHAPRESRVTVVEQAGVGGPLSYGSATVLEVGGSGSLSMAGKHLYLRMAPYVAWFVLDGLSLSYVHEIYVTKQDARYRVATAPMLAASVHFRVTDRLLVSTGPEFGALYNGDEWGVLGRIRLGLDILVGRSGVLHPSIYGAWASADTIDAAGTTVFGQHLSLGFDIAYGAMF